MEKNHFNCIYLYTNKVNDKKYVGQTVDFNKRHKQHIRQAYNENDKAYDYTFHRAIRKYGIDNFEVEILKENLQNQEQLNYWECFYINKFDLLAKNGQGYNLASGGSNGNPYAGKTEEEKAERNRKFSETWKNKSEEEIKEFSRKLSKAHKGKILSEEEKVKIRRKKSKTWNNKSDEEKAEFSRKLSEANKGKTLSEETKAKISKAHKGKPNGKASQLVDRFTLNNELIDTKYLFEYKAMGFYITHISDCCKGKRKSTGGFIFKYHTN